MGVNFSRRDEVDESTDPSSRTSSAHPCSTDGGGARSRDEIRNTMDKQTSEHKSEDEFFDTQEETPPISHAEEMEQFKKELAIKREQRRKIIAKHASEKENLRNSLETQIKANEKMNEENKSLRELLEQHNINAPSTAVADTDVSELQGPIAILLEDLERFKAQNLRLRVDLSATNVSLQAANSDIASMQGENVQAMKQITALKDVVAVTKTMMKIRESQLIELKAKLTEIETSLAERETGLLSAELQAEYERQLQNIRTLRALYEERARLAELTKLQLLRELEEQRELVAVESSRCQELTAKVAELESKISDMGDAIDNKDDQISVTREETRGLKAEMSTVNKLFSQMLLGHQSQQDLDKLVTRLEENHGLLAHMVSREGGSETSSALPKLLLELVSQVDSAADSAEGGDGDKKQPEGDESSLNTTAEEIVGNLPKVWRVLMELLSHQAAPAVPSDTPATCYKSVDTPSGSRLVPSVSQTYIRLKDLIVEKLSLTKDMNKMKQLNSHLETRLEEQERRLCLVTSELSKTWHVVGRLRRHHHQLHTHEKILRYELQQKRKMLNELKEELEYCREKWDKAREKNTESEKEWRKLRTEFSSRKSNVNINNSGESGYSDERQTEDDSTESNDDSECVNDLPVRCKKRTKKSVDILPDSSTDHNLVAEREDPISDMLDVAELPLDGLDADESIGKTSESLKDNDEDFSASDSSTSESFSKKKCVINSEPLPQSSQEPSVSICVDDTAAKDTKIKDSSGSRVMVANISEATASESDNADNNKKTDDDSELREKTQIAREAQLEALEESSASLLEQVSKTAELRKDISKRLENYHSQVRDANSAHGLTVLEENSENKSIDIDETTNSETGCNLNETSISSSQSSMTNVIIKTLTNKEAEEQNVANSNQIDPSTILESIRIQNERLAHRDERMKNLEEGCSSLLQTSKNTLQLGVNLENRLDTIHAERNPDISQDSDSIESTVDLVSDKSTNFNDTNELFQMILPAVTEDIIEQPNEPSTSTASPDHEARFAARDERLKRLEEQAKSLVDKVNDTATKSVKITYKLEELHNIYGSEGSSSRNESPEVNGEEDEEEPQDEDAEIK